MALVDGVHRVQALGHLGVPVLGDVLGERFGDQSTAALTEALGERVRFREKVIGERNGCFHT